MRASLSRHGVDVGGDAAEGDDDGARKLRVIPLLEARSKLTPKLHKEQAIICDTWTRPRGVYASSARGTGCVIGPSARQTIGSARQLFTWTDSPPRAPPHLPH